MPTNLIQAEPGDAEPEPEPMTPLLDPSTRPVICVLRQSMLYRRTHVLNFTPTRSEAQQSRAKTGRFGSQAEPSKAQPSEVEQWPAHPPGHILEHLGTAHFDKNAEDKN